jgi:hypothetical protein
VPNTGDQCVALPIVHQSAFAVAYTSALTSLVTTIQQFLTSTNPSGGVITAIKAGGLNGMDLELHIPGNNQWNGDPATNPVRRSCGGGQYTFPYSCGETSDTSPADYWLSKYEYYPDGVEDTWNAINSTVQTLRNGLGSAVAYEVNVEGAQQVPPVTSQNNSHDFNCRYQDSQQQNLPMCAVFEDGGGPDTPDVTSAFVQNVLLADLINGSGSFSGFSPSTVAVQFDGLVYDNENGSHPTEAELKGVPTCWAYNNWTQPHTIIGLQSSLAQRMDGNGMNYITALSNGANLGAQYEELIATQVNLYMNINLPLPQARANYLGAVQTNLIGNSTGAGGFCQ